MTDHTKITAAPGMLLGDDATRDYSDKLRRFNAFAAPELQAAIGSLALRDGMTVLDVGCGTGEALNWLWSHVAPSGAAWGIDLSAAHVEHAARNHPQLNVVQGDILTATPVAAPLDLIWCVNTLHHLADPLAAAGRLREMLKPDGRLAVGQSLLLPDMVFAWDARLERIVTHALREYYRDRYALSEQRLTAVRAVLGTLRRAGFTRVTACTRIIERIAPLASADQDYLLGVVFGDMFGSKLRPYLADDDYQQLARLCDPASAEFALRRDDFHFLQTFSLVIGHNG